MGGPDLLLLDVQDLPDARPADALARLEALAHAGFEARAVIVGGAEEVPAHPRLARAEGPRAALEAVRAAPGARVLVASAAPGGGALGARLGGRAAAWWPTAAAHGSVPWWARRAGGALEPLVRDARGPCAVALATAVADPRAAARPRLPLWDGDYVLVPAAPSAAGARAAVAAFAAVADAGDALDLVVLGAPCAALAEAAHARGLGLRVHAAGRATREAEWAWLGDARAVVLDAGALLPAGLVARALAAGAAPLVAGDGAAAAALRDGLAALGAHASAAAAGLSAAALARALAVGAAGAAPARRGACAPAAVGARLAAALGGARPAARAA